MGPGVGEAGAAAGIGMIAGGVEMLAGFVMSCLWLGAKTLTRNQLAKLKQMVCHVGTSLQEA